MKTTIYFIITIIMVINTLHCLGSCHYMYHLVILIPTIILNFIVYWFEIEKRLTQR